MISYLHGLSLIKSAGTHGRTDGNGLPRFRLELYSGATSAQTTIQIITRIIISICAMGNSPLSSDRTWQKIQRILDEIDANCQENEANEGR